jgi:ATP-dependent Clp protease ATP-binding subunit ClpC
MGHSYIGSEHLLLGILSEESSFSCTELNKRGVYYKIIKKRIISISGVCPADVENEKKYDESDYVLKRKSFSELEKLGLLKDKMTPKCKAVILKAENFVASQCSGEVTADIFLYALLKEECVGLKLLVSAGIEPSELHRCIEVYLERNSFKNKKVSTPLLDKISVDLTEKASKGLIEPIIGREETEDKIIQILLRKSKKQSLSYR